VWADELGEEFFAPEHSDTQDRFIRIGHSTASRLLLIICCEREERTRYSYHLSPQATSKEEKEYEEEYDLKKLRPRTGAVKVDKNAAKIPISLRVDESVLALLKSEAERLGLPYQTFIGSLLHQYVRGELTRQRRWYLGRS